MVVASRLFFVLKIGWTVAKLHTVETVKKKTDHRAG